MTTKTLTAGQMCDFWEGAETSPLTDAERARVQARHRGRLVADGYRNFCCECGLPLAVEWMQRLSLKARCPECAPVVGRGNGGVGSVLPIHRRDDEAGPWQENNIRLMEDGHE